ncbi:MAG: hypothetical protein PF513_00655 [Tenericutes bacterium]|jgi:hypothetical protein|nr:hypothetical protein [Mycoplasmatota bacterium]
MSAHITPLMYIDLSGYKRTTIAFYSTDEDNKSNNVDYPEWLYIDIFYVETISDFNVTTDHPNLSLGNFEIAVARMGYRGKLNSADSNTNYHIEINILTAEAYLTTLPDSLSIGFKAQILSIDGEFALGNSIKIGGELRVGLGFGLTVSNNEFGFSFTWFELYFKW